MAVRINQLKAGVILSYVQMALGNMVNLVYTPVMLRILGQSEYGLYSLSSSVVSYLGLLNFGFGSAYVRYYSRYKLKKDEDSIAKLNGMFLMVFLVMGIVALIAGGALVFNVENIFGAKLTASELKTAKVLMAIMVFNLAASLPASVFTSNITANEEYFFQRLINMIKTVVNPFVMLPVLLLGYKSIGMAVITTVITLAVNIINIFYCFKKLKMKISFRGFDFGLLKEIYVFSFYIFLNMIVNQINWNVDKFLLGMFQGTVAVAVYGVAANINNYYISFSTSISSVFVPKINRIVAQNDDALLNDLFTKVGRIQFIVISLIGSGFIFFGKEFIIKWAGENYGTSYIIALLLILPISIDLIQNTSIEIERAKNIHKFRSILYLFMAVGNVLVSIPLCKAYGGVGSAAGTAAALILGNGIGMNIYYQKRVGLDIVYFWKNILKFVPALIIPTVSGILIRCFVDLGRLRNFLIFGFVYVIVFAASMWFSGMNEYEKDLVMQPIRRLLAHYRRDSGD